MSALMTMLSGLIFTVLMVPAYARQEVTPDWFDPWTAPNAAMAQAAKPVPQKPARAMKSSSVASAKSVHPVRRPERMLAKRAKTRPSAS
jgi:hypothetical protein